MSAVPDTATDPADLADADPRLSNDDLLPARSRHWKVYDVFALWMSDVHNLGNYTFAAGLIVLGLSAFDVLTSLLIGFVLIFVGMNLMGRIGQRHGVPFPVVARISFGVFGANVPALIRAVIATFWYGIQTYLAANAVVVMLLAIWPGLKPMTTHSFVGLDALTWIAFLALWVIQALIMTRGMESIRKFQDFCGPAIWVVMIALAVFVLSRAHWSIPLFTSPFLATPLSGGAHLAQWIGAIGLILATYGTLMLNFCDFSRNCPDYRTVRRGNFWGLPINSTAFVVLSVIVTAGAYKAFGLVGGKPITDPSALLAEVGNKPAMIVGAATFAVATMGVNVVANFVSPAYDFANVWPKHITFTKGGMIAAVGALVVTPWNLFNSPVVVNYFLGGLGAFLGPLFGVIMVDYFFVKKQMIKVPELFSTDPSGAYWYKRGVNPRAIWSFVPAAVIAGVVALVPGFGVVSSYSWFIGAALGGAIYRVVARHDEVTVDTVERAAA